MRTIIVEDEPGPLVTLKNQILNHCPHLDLVGEATNIKEAQMIIEKELPELVFLDIHLPDGSAFDLLDNCQPLSFNIVFTTAYEQFALKAFQYNAAHYLVKPLFPEQLIEAVNRITNIRPSLPDIKDFIDLFQKKQKPDRIAIPSVSTITYVELANIVRFESEGSYTHIHLTSGKPLLSTKPLKAFDELLSDNGFCRVHRSHLVGISHIKKYCKGKADTIILTGDIAIEVPRKKRTEILLAIRRH